MAKDETVLLVGGAAVVGLLVLFLYQKNAAAQQQNALDNQLSQISSQQTPVDILGGVLSGVGGLFASGSLGNLTSAFSSTGTSNQPGLMDDDDNDPGLVSGDSDDDEDYGD
jgi:hypothetical protein